MKALIKCCACHEDKTSRAFVKGYWVECRACMKYKYLLYAKILKQEKKIHRVTPFKEDK